MEPSEPAGDGLITFQVNPRSAVLAPGDSLPVRVDVSALVASPRVTVRVRAAGPVLVRLDTTVAREAAVVLRAAAAGTDSVRVTIQVDEAVAETWLPVIVRPRA